MEKKTLLQRVREALADIDGVNATYVYSEERVTIMVHDGHWTEELGKQVIQTLNDAGISTTKDDKFAVPYWAHKNDPKTGRFIPKAMKPRIMTIDSR